jgi:hypothetical protein
VFGWDGFPDALFYKAQYALRFELGCELPEDPVRFLRAMDRARALSEATFSASPRLTVAVSYYDGERRTSRAATSFKKLAEMGFRAPFDGFDKVAVNDREYIEAFGSDLYCYWYSAEIVNEPSQLSVLLWACVAAEGGVTPKARWLENIYIVDFERGIAAHVYDDRGMDIVAIDRREVQPLYNQFNDWLLDYDRAEMDVVFSDA